MVIFMENTKERDLFKGSLTKSILLYTLPIMATSLLQLLFNTADLVVVGQFKGPGALAAVGSTSALINLIVNILIGLSVGAAVVVAQAWGAGDRLSLERAVHSAMAIALVGGVIFGAIGFFFGGSMLRLMATDADVIDAATLYIRIYFVGVPAGMIYNFGAAILRAIGNTRTPLLYLTLAGVCNIFLNLLFVAVFGMGVEGVALATALSQLVSALLVVIYLLKSKEAYRLQLKKVRFYKKEVVQTLRIGLPAGLQGALFSISNVIVQSSVNSFKSVAVVAGNTAAMTAEGYVYVVMNSFGNSAMTYVGQTTGAGRHDRIPGIAVRCLSMVTVFGLVTGVVMYLFNRPVLSLFATADADISMEQVFEVGAKRMFMICLPYFLCGLMDVLTGMLRGMGYSTVPMIISVIGVCLVRILWIYTYFAAHHELSVLYFSYPLSWFLTAAVQGTLFVILYRVMKKKQPLSRIPS